MVAAMMPRVPSEMKFSWFERRMLDRLGLLFFAITMVSTALLGVLRPVFNWDMIPYVALAEERPGMDDAMRHDRAYQLVHAAAPAQDWTLLIQAGRYRVRQYADAEAFDTQLGMYRIKVGYVAAARALNPFVPTIEAYRLINLLALTGLSVVAIWWMHVGQFGRAAFFLVPILLIAELPSAAQLVTPDLLCASFAAAGLALLRRGSWRLAAACFTAATLTRPDFIFFPAAWLAVALSTRTSRKEAVSCFAATAAAYGLTMLMGDYSGWWPHFSVSLIERVDDLRAVPPFSLEAYLRGFAVAMVANVTSQIWPALVLLLTACWLSLRDRQGPRQDQADGLFLALILSLAARCIVFPMPDDRLYLPTMIMLSLLTVERWATRANEAKSKGDAGFSV
jgi:hypothetical protein